MAALTPEEAAEAWEAVLQALYGIVVLQVAPDGGANNAKVVSEMLMDRSGHVWAGLLRTETDVDPSGRARVHTWMVDRARTSRYPDRTVQSSAIEMTFTIDGYLAYEPRNGSGSRFRKEVARISRALELSPNLGLPSVKSHTGLREGTGLAKMGAQDVHESLGQITVQLMPIVNR